MRDGRGTGRTTITCTHTTKLAARGRLLDELADLDGEAPVAVEETAPVAAPVTEKAVLEPETLFFEGPPSKTELIVPGLSVLTVIGIVPFAAGAPRARPGSSTRSLLEHQRPVRRRRPGLHGDRLF